MQNDISSHSCSTSISGQNSLWLKDANIEGARMSEEHRTLLEQRDAIGKPLLPAFSSRQRPHSRRGRADLDENLIALQVAERARLGT